MVKDFAEIKRGLNKNGGAVATTDAPPSLPIYLHDFIPFLPQTQENIFLKCSPLYAEGLSLSEIGRQTGIARNTIRDAFIANGLPIRSHKSGTEEHPKNPMILKSSVPPYGYAYVRGVMVPAPKEHKTVLKIYQLWTSGLTLGVIAQKLDNQKIPTRSGRKWSRELIKKIIERHETDLKNNNK